MIYQLDDRKKSCFFPQYFSDNKKPFLTDNGNDIVEVFGNQRFISAMEQIKQQIARENINFVRFEATDLHGVSRSKTVPVRFFHVNPSAFLPSYLLNHSPPFLLTYTY